MEMEFKDNVTAATTTTAKVAGDLNSITTDSDMELTLEDEGEPLFWGSEQKTMVPDALQHLNM